MPPSRRERRPTGHMGDGPDVVGEVLVEGAGGAAGQPLLDDVLLEAGAADPQAGKARDQVRADRVGDSSGEDLEIGAGLTQHLGLAGAEVGEVGEGVESRRDEGAVIRDTGFRRRLGGFSHPGSLNHMASSFWYGHKVVPLAARSDRWT